jgi:threonine synthase
VLGPTDRVVLLVTGDGLKTPAPVRELFSPVEIDADADVVLDLVASGAAA